MFPQLCSLHFGWSISATLMVFSLLASAALTADVQPSSYGNAQYNTYGNHHHTYGGRYESYNGPQLTETRRKPNTLRQPPILSIQEQQQQLMEEAKPIPEKATFNARPLCLQMCEIGCVMMTNWMGPGESTFQWYCEKLRPPPKALHQKFIDRIGEFGPLEFVIGGILALALALCVLCTCYQCCCRTACRSGGGPPRNRRFSFQQDHHPQGDPNKSQSLNGGGTITTTGTGGGLSPERESLTNGAGGTQPSHIPHIDGVIHPAPIMSTTGNGQNGASQFGHGHHGPQFSRMNMVSASREQSIV